MLVSPLCITNFCKHRTTHTKSQKHVNCMPRPYSGPTGIGPHVYWAPRALGPTCFPHKSKSSIYAISRCLTPSSLRSSEASPLWPTPYLSSQASLLVSGSYVCPTVHQTKSLEVERQFNFDSNFEPLELVLPHCSALFPFPVSCL